MSPEAYEVIEFFNITTRPKWVVVKNSNAVFLDKRTYHGAMTFNDLKRYLNIFASKEMIDRKVDTGYGHTKIRDQVLKTGSKIKAVEFDFNDFKSNFLYDDIIILHICDTFSLNYPNLIVFQNFYG